MYRIDEIRVYCPYCDERMKIVPGTCSSFWYCEKDDLKIPFWVAILPEEREEER